VAVSMLALLLVVAACGGNDQPEAQRPEATTTAADATLAGVVFTPPQHWRDLGPSGMRQAQYQLDPVEGDSAPAEVAVFYFGPASGGGVEANLQRWIGQMSLPDGGDPAQAATRDQFTAGSMPAHLVSLDGTYNAGGMGGMGGGSEPAPGYRLVGVVLEGPQGSLFFKLTGPEATATAMEADLLAMVKGARSGG